MANKFKRLAKKVRSLRTDILTAIAGAAAGGNGRIALDGHLVHLTEDGGIRVEAVAHDIVLEKKILVLRYSNTETWAEGSAVLQELPLEDLAGLLDVMGSCDI